MPEYATYFEEIIKLLGSIRSLVFVATCFYGLQFGWWLGEIFGKITNLW